MVTVKCKFCGDDIVLTGGSVARCESCGTLVTIPKINDEKVAKMYDRGNHFRELGDFDEAYSAYEQIVAENPFDAEARWCLVLCRFGIEYVKDSRTVNYMPTLSRMSFDSILEDRDYLKALKCADEETAALYRKEARKIAAIQERYLKIARTEKPYDVFICFKAEEDNGKRTKGSVEAQELYEMLTARGLSVFFSRITLEDKITEEYEPYIFAALNSAKVMLVVANKKEHLQARWVRNEWMRFLRMMDTDSTKHIIPIYVDIEPEDFPAEIPKVQGKKIKDVGAKATIVSNVMELTGKTEKIVVKTQKKEGPQVENILSRVEVDLLDGDFSEAESRVKDVLKKDPENGEAFYYLLLIKNRVNDSSKLVSISLDWSEDSDFKKALRYANKERKTELQSVLDRCSAEKKRQEEIALKREQEALRKSREIEGHVKKYREELGDARTYVRRKIQENHPKEYKKYEKLCDNFSKKSGAAGNTITLLWGVALTLLSVVYLFMMMQGAIPLDGSEGGETAFIFSMVFSVLTILCCYSGLNWAEEFYSIFRYILTFIGFYMGYMLIPAFVIGMGTSFEVEAIPGIIKVVCALPSLLVGIVFALKGFAIKIRKSQFDSAQEVLRRYERDTIIPLEEKYRKEINDRYEKLIGTKNLAHLPGIRR